MHVCAMAGAPARAAASRPVVYSQKATQATPVQARRSVVAKLLGAGMLLSGGPSSAASFNDSAKAKAQQKAQLLEETRARAEGRAPRQLAPAASGEEVSAKAPAAKAEPAASFNDAAVQRQSAKAALLAEARQKALASGASVNGAKKK